MLQNPKYNRSGSLTVIAILFLSFLAIVLLLQLQQTNAEIQTNQQHTRHYQQLINQ